MGLEQTRKNLVRRGLAIEGEEPPKRKERKPKEPKGEIRNLDDPAEQEKILNPDPSKIVLDNGSEITLHEPSAQLKRWIIGFYKDVFVASIRRTGYEIPSVIPGTAEEQMRVLGTKGVVAAVSLLLGENYDEKGRLYSERLFWYIVQMYDRPGRIVGDRAVELAAELSAQASEDDIAKLFTALLNVQKIKDPKN